MKMRKSLLIIIFMVFILERGFTQTWYDNNTLEIINNRIDYCFSTYSMISPFLSKTFDFNTSTLSLLSYDDYKAEKAKDRKWGAFALNFFFGIGIGSFYQGDTKGGLIGLCGEAFSGLIMVGGYIIGLGGNADLGIGTMIAGLGLFFGIRIFELIRPFIYTNKFSFAIAPVIDENGRPIVAAMVKLKL